MRGEPNKDSINENRPEYMNGKAIRNYGHSGVFNDSLSSSEYITSNDRMIIDNELIWKEAGMAEFMVLSRQFPGRSEENQESG
jgi:hypothetical protein